MKASTNISVKDKSSMVLDDFKGVDFSSSPLTVSTSRATDMANLIHDYGVNRKRHGWKQLIRVGKGNINGIFNYKQGFRDDLIVHIGDEFYRVYKANDRYTSESLMNTCTYEAAKLKPELLLDRRSQVFYSKGRAYIIGCGDYLVYGTWNNGETYELRRVEDNEDTYIPTTTISIDDTSVTDPVRASLDEVNILSTKRKNTLRGTTTCPATWQLDASIDTNTLVVVDVTFLYTQKDGAKVAKTTRYLNKDSTKPSKLFKVAGSTDDYAIEGEINFPKGQITINSTTEPPSNDDNITVTFYHRMKNTSKQAYARVKGSDNVPHTIKLGGAIIDKSVEIEIDTYETFDFGGVYKVGIIKDEFHLPFSPYAPLYGNIKRGGTASQPTGVLCLKFSTKPPRQYGQGKNIEIIYTSNDEENRGERIREEFLGTVEEYSEYTLKYPVMPDTAFNVGVSVEVQLYDKTKKTTIRCHQDFKDSSILVESLEEYQIGKIDINTGYITFTERTPTADSNNDENIRITYERDISSGGYIISRCKFGTLFGIDGNRDRLFVSGNEDYPNTDFYSEMDDFTYFAERNTASIGSDDSPIVGYAGLSDSTLAIFKDSNNNEPTIYYRTGRYLEQNEIEVRGVFPTYAGSIGEGIISGNACANFAGDSLILSRNGVFGITLSNNVATSERYARERSRAINEKLTKYNLPEAVGVVHNNKYYLVVNGDCFVADSRFKYTREDDIDGSYNYEWWFWNHIPARVLASINNNLYFGTSDGRICVFDNEYTDRTYDTTEEGELAVNIPESKFIYNTDISKTIEVELKDNDIIKSIEQGLYSLVQENCEVVDGRIKASESEIMTLFEGIEVYADNVENCGLQEDTVYRIHNVDKGECLYSLMDSTGAVITLSSGGFNLCKNLYEKSLYTCDVTSNTFKLKERESSDALRLHKYKDVMPSKVLMEIEHRDNIVAKWFSPVMDFGTNEQGKTLLKLTISAEPEVKGKVMFGYATRNIDRLVQSGELSKNKRLSGKGINLFSFDDLNFETFSFEPKFASSYSVKVKERNFNYIMFGFISDNDQNCAINSMTAIYKINKANRGVR